MSNNEKLTEELLNSLLHEEGSPVGAGGSGQKEKKEAPVTVPQEEEKKIEEAKKTPEIQNPPETTQLPNERDLTFDELVKKMAKAAKDAGFGSKGKLRTGVFTFRQPPLERTFFKHQRVHYVNVGEKGGRAPVICDGEGCGLCKIMDSLTEAGHDVKSWMPSDQYFAIIHYLDSEIPEEVRIPAGTWYDIFEKAAYIFDLVTGIKIEGKVRDFIKERACFRCNVINRDGSTSEAQKRFRIKYDITMLSDKIELKFPLETTKIPQGMTKSMPVMEACEKLVKALKDKGIGIIKEN